VNCSNVQSTMGKKTEPYIIQEIQVSLAKGEAVKSIHRRTRVAVKTIRKFRLNYTIYGQPYAPQVRVIGRNPILLNYQKDVS
jgi:flagellar basal body rod protein FlgC